MVPGMGAGALTGKMLILDDKSYTIGGQIVRCYKDMHWMLYSYNIDVYPQFQ